MAGMLVKNSKLHLVLESELPTTSYRFTALTLDWNALTSGVEEHYTYNLETKINPVGLLLNSDGSNLISCSEREQKLALLYVDLQNGIMYQQATSDSRYF